jgi:thiosulfate dehydrogenase [quinone] large subunit
MSNLSAVFRSLSPSSLAFLLIRSWLGMRLFFSGVMKCVSPTGEFSLANGLATHLWIVPMFDKSILPRWIVVPYAHSLMWFEFALGLALLLGIKPRTSLFLSALVFLTLAFGQLMLANYDKVDAIGLYVVVCAFGLLLSPHSRLDLVPDRS